MDDSLFSGYLIYMAAIAAFVVFIIVLKSLRGFFKNLFYSRIIGIVFLGIFCVPTFLLFGEKSISTEDIIRVFCASIAAFVIIYGIPVNMFVSKYKKNLRKNLGIRLVKEVNKCNGNYAKFNEKNNQFLSLVKNYVVKELTLQEENSPDRIAEIDKEISELKNTIEVEKITTDKLITKHPFISTLQDLQNRAS